MTELIDVLKRKHEVAEKLVLKSLMALRKVRDHCHFTGLYRGSAQNCSVKYWITDNINIGFHNLGGYDAYLFIRELGKSFNKDDIRVIVENKKN